MQKENIKQKLIQIQEILKEIPGVHIHDIRNFIGGNLSINKNNELKIPLVLPAEELLSNSSDVREVIQGNWKIVPLLMFVEE